MTSLLLQVQTTIADPVLARNMRGQLSAALRLLDTSTHQWLACDFAEHGLWMLDRVSKADPMPRRALNVMREYLSGSTTWETVARTDHDLYTFGYSIGSYTSFERKVAYEAWIAVAEAMKVCCHAALKQARRGIWSRNWRPNAMDVAIQVSHTVGLNAAGEAWNAKDAAIRASARKKGYQASDEETKWQIGNLLDFVANR
jgi:hypothetical protein